MEEQLKALSDEDLSSHLNAVLAEQERRARLASAPATIAQIAARYTEDGGDVAALREVLV